MSHVQNHGALADLPMLIPCGGLGSRLSPFANGRPKCLIEIDGLPFIVHVFNLLKQEGIRRIVLLVGYQADQVSEFVKDGQEFGMQVTYSKDGNEALGTGGSIIKALPLVEDEFAVMYGDTYLDVSFAPIYQAFRESQRLGLMTILEKSRYMSGCSDIANVEFDRTSKRVVIYDKEQPKQRMQFIDFGLSFFHKTAFENFKNVGKFDLGLVFQELAKSAQLEGYEVSHPYHDLNTKDSLEKTTAYLSGKNRKQFD